MLIRPLACCALAILMTFGSLQRGADGSDADELVETSNEHSSGLEFAGPVAERLVIRSVAPHSPAAAAGLCAGDIVLGIDRYHFVTAAEAEAYLDCQCLHADPVRFTVLRDGAEHKLTLIGYEPHRDVYGILPPEYGPGTGIGIRLAGTEPVVIVAVYGGSPADRAGILPGDELLAVDDVAYSHAPAVSAAMARHRAGDEVRLLIRRDGADQTVAVTPEEWRIALDEPVHVLPGWEGRYRLGGCRVPRDQFATRIVLAGELESLRAEIRQLRNELIETNARLAARPAALEE